MSNTDGAAASGVPASGAAAEGQKTEGASDKAAGATEGAEGDKTPSGEGGDKGEGGEGEPELTDEQKAAKATEAARTLNERKRSTQERINEAVRAQREAERRADRAEREARELRTKGAKPDPAKFDDVAEHQAAVTEAALNRRDAEARAGDAKTARTEADEAVASAWQDRVELFRDQAPDFDAVALKAPITDDVAKDVALMEEGPAIAYYLGKNPATAKNLNKMGARERLVELGRIAAKLTTQPARKTSTAPTPVDAVAGRGSKSGAFDAGKSSYDEYAAKRRAGWKG